MLIPDLHIRPIRTFPARFLLSMRIIRFEIRNFFAYLPDYYFSLRKGTNFHSPISQDALESLSDTETSLLKIDRSNAIRYETARISTIEPWFDKLLESHGRFDYFLDVGSGKGKVLQFAVQKKVATSFIGVELDPYLHFEALRSAKKNDCPISFINTDILRYSIPKSNGLIFLFNPFGEVVLEEFLRNNLISSFEYNCQYLYINDVHSNIFLQLGFHKIASGHRSSVYSMPTLGIS